jgi:beta-glucanase (GH16 family)
MNARALRNVLPVLLAAIALASCGGAAMPPEKTPAWRDEFDGEVGSTPDRTRWTYDLGASGWGNRELEEYTDSADNAAIVADPAAGDGKALAITARRDESGHVTSARLKTQGLFAQRYGRFEARIKLPTGQGIWPAFWMLGDDIGKAGWPACGEIDIMEHLGHEPTIVHGTIHGPGYSAAQGPTATYTLPAGRFPEGYHVFAVEWAPDAIHWYVDDARYSTKTPADIGAGNRWAFDHPFFLLLNVAVGGNWPGYPDETTRFPQSMLVDYVRVYS